jgi:hypothetical protein
LALASPRVKDVSPPPAPAYLGAGLQAVDVPGELGHRRRGDAMRSRHMIECREVRQHLGDDPLCLTPVLSDTGY